MTVIVIAIRTMFVNIFMMLCSIILLIHSSSSSWYPARPWYPLQHEDLLEFPKSEALNPCEDRDKTLYKPL